MTSSLRRRLRAATLVACAAVLPLSLTPPASASAAAPTPGYGRFPVVIDVRGPEKCLAVDRLPGNRTPITAQTCGDNVFRAQWTVSVGHPATSATPVSVRLKSMENGRCLDADGATLGPFLEGEAGSFIVQSFACNDFEQQEWNAQRTSTASRFTVVGLTPAQNRRFLLQVRPSSAQNPGYLSTFQSFDLDRTIPDGTPVFGGPTALGATIDLNVTVDSPAIQCAAAGFSGAIQRVPNSLLNFRCT